MSESFPPGMVEALESFFHRQRMKREWQWNEDLYHEVFVEPFFMPLQRKREMQRMMRRAREIEPWRILDVGSDKGGGLFHWCAGFQPGRVCSIDLRGQPYAQLFKQHFDRIDFLWLPCSSYEPEVVARVGKWLAGDRFDIVFLDGDKSAFHKDFDAYVDMVRPGGLIIFHDIKVMEPGAAFATAARHPRVATVETIIDNKESREAMQRECEGIPSSGCYEDWLRLWKNEACGVGILELM